MLFFYNLLDIGTLFHSLSIVNLYQPCLQTCLYGIKYIYIYYINNIVLWLIYS